MVVSITLALGAISWMWAGVWMVPAMQSPAFPTQHLLDDDLWAFQTGHRDHKLWTSNGSVWFKSVQMFNEAAHQWRIVWHRNQCKCLVDVSICFFCSNRYLLHPVSARSSSSERSTSIARSTSSFSNYANVQVCGRAHIFFVILGADRDLWHAVVNTSEDGKLNAHSSLNLPGWQLCQLVQSVTQLEAD